MDSQLSFCKTRNRKKPIKSIPIKRSRTYSQESLTKQSGIFQNLGFNDSKQNKKFQKEREYSNINFTLLTNLVKKIEDYDMKEHQVDNSHFYTTPNSARINNSKYLFFKKISLEQIFHSYIRKYQGERDKKDMEEEIEKLIEKFRGAELMEELNICLITTQNFLLFVKFFQDDFKQERRFLEQRSLDLDLEVYYDPRDITCAKICNIPTNLNKFIHVRI